MYEAKHTIESAEIGELQFCSLPTLAGSVQTEIPVPRVDSNIAKKCLAPLFIALHQAYFLLNHYPTNIVNEGLKRHIRRKERASRHVDNDVAAELVIVGLKLEIRKFFWTPDHH